MLFSSLLLQTWFRVLACEFRLFGISTILTILPVAYCYVSAGNEDMSILVGANVMNIFNEKGKCLNIIFLIPIASLYLFGLEPELPRCFARILTAIPGPFISIMSELKLERVKYFPLLMAGCMLLAVSLPYVITVASEKVNMFLPYISHAAAFPPQSAFLSIFMAIGTFFAVPTFFLRFAAVDQKRNRLEPRKIKILNIIAVCAGVFAAIAMLLSSHYPVGYVTHERMDWMKSVVVPHFTCTALLVTLYTMYVLIQAYLTYVHRKRSTKNVFVHATLSMCVVITNWTSCLPFYAAMREMGPRIVDAETGEISLESQEYSFYYIISSLSEWAFTFFSILFIATFYRDFKNMNLRLKVSLKKITDITLDSVQATAHSSANGHEEITKM